MPPDYVQYHNTDKLKRKPTYNGKRVGIFWMGRRSVPMGARVWLVAGETVARTKRYWLYDWFVADKVDIRAREASGSQFQCFRPPVEIGRLPWFKEFQYYMGNFGRGLSPLRPVDVEHFAAASGAAASSLPPAATLVEGSGFGTPEQNRKVELAAIAAVTTHYASTGWKVESVEADKCGYDLLCRSGKLERHVEVKGMAGAGAPSCVLTENELRCARSDPKWQLIVVGSALNRPVLHTCDACDIDARFTIAPIAYRMTGK